MQRQREQRDADELTEATGDVTDPATSDLHDTGSTSGRSPERLRKNRCKSTRIFSLMSPGSVRSSTPARLDASPPAVHGISLSSASVRASSTNPRVITSGRLLERAGLRADRDDRHDQPVAGQVAAVPQHFVADLAAPRAVDEDPARRHLARQPPALVVEPDHVAVFGEQDLRCRRATPGSAIRGVPGELAVLAVYRHEVARPDQGKHQFQLFLAPMPGNVDVLEAFVDELGAAPGDVVHHPANRLLVARNLTRREHDHVLGVRA